MAGIEHFYEKETGTLLLHSVFFQLKKIIQKISIKFRSRRSKMSWLEDPRKSFTHVSTHQTYVGKALYEHAPNCATIAAVACMSSSLLKSSLGPNLLALIRVDDDTFDLFDKIFLEYNPHMQLTQKLDVMFLELDHSKELIEKLKASGPLLSSSLLQAKVDSEWLPLLEGFRALRSLTLESVARSKQLSFLKSLRSLEELELTVQLRFDAVFFKVLGDLENNRNLTSLTIDDFSDRVWCSEGFQKDFCGRLLSKNQLTKLDLPYDFWRRMNEADGEAFVNARMTNLLELRRGASAKLIRGEGFGNLRFLSVSEVSDDDLVNIGNHCLFLEVFAADVTRATGSFLRHGNLVDDAFKHLRELDLGNASFRDSDVGTRLSRLPSLETLFICATNTFDGSFLRQLSNPDRLRAISIAGGNSSMSNLHRFVNLEEIDLHGFKLSRDDILSLAVLKQLNRMKLMQCGEDTASSEPFSVLCPQLSNLEKFNCSGLEETRWTEADVEVILTECKSLRELEFNFRAGFFQKLIRLEKKYPGVTIRGTLQRKTVAEQESGSRREREE